MGFEALATTSLGVANTLGSATVSLAEIIDNCRVICEATDLPVNADLENGGAHEPKAASQAIRLAAEAGCVGGSIEDMTGDRSKPIYDFNLAVERVQAAVEVARSLPFPFMLTRAKISPWPKDSTTPSSGCRPQAAAPTCSTRPDCTTSPPSRPSSRR
jgi:2-methylisocitrate lyase-like PEP mutase family enzyme